MIVGGLGPDGTPSSATWVYDTVAHSWTQGQNFPDLGYADSMALANGKAYVIGHSQGQLYEYDLATDTWTTIPATGANGVPAPRVLALSAQDGDTAWLAGGEDLMTAGALDDVWELDLATATWTPCEDLPEPLRHSAMAVIDGGGALAPNRVKVATSSVQLLIFGGLNSQGQVNENQYIYEPNTWFTYLPLVVRH